MQPNFISIPIGYTFSFNESLWFLNRNFDDCLHSVSTNLVRKALLINNKPLLLEIAQKNDSLQIEILSGDYQNEDESEISAYIIEWLDLDRDVSFFYKLLNSDERLSYMTLSFAGLRLVGIPDLFEALCWGIIGQQINLTFAYKLKRRLVEKYGTQMEFENEAYHIFPSCEVLAKADLQDLKAMQFSSKKAEYIIGLAQIFTDGKLSKGILKLLPDVAARQKALTSIKGIGVWTANYALMKCLKEQTSIPYGDTGLMQALFTHQIIEHKKDYAPVEKFFTNFEGWESYLVFYLWRSLAKNDQLDNSSKGQIDSAF
ncbi:DNA-3-methyladenine glycosylase II [Dyadobacter koreensis]|uniref:DNA-3-methyladenine glycosylase II n=1 Tax=Dyadobacter koreensis TaxID=408657 RepID=A0A1H6T723_9BACT|nr:DNA-3-methyladenine glycosylase [Dyadobacter koreensis]SEI73954.1 DNA-3-methyladenine glycosylase II [Dyadobacter koreensis]